ncbi:Uncharacterised protein g5748 [Pycnogonum litorale]
MASVLALASSVELLSDDELSSDEELCLLLLLANSSKTPIGSHRLDSSSSSDAESISSEDIESHSSMEYDESSTDSENSPVTTVAKTSTICSLTEHNEHMMLPVQCYQPELSTETDDTANHVVPDLKTDE